MDNIDTKQDTNIFESIKHLDEIGEEYWNARELMPVLEYKTWEGFHEVVKRAEHALSKIYPQTTDHFRQLKKMIKVAAGTNKETKRSIVDYELTRRACYLIAQNGDSRKQAIALAQNYFATQTRKQELKEIKEKDIERILVRRKLTESEKKFSGVMTELGIDGKGIAEIKSSGDAALFGEPTSEVKKKLGISQSTPLADHLPSISLKAKDLATEMTTFKTQDKQLSGKDLVKIEHISNNSAIRKMLTESGIYPERLPAEEDIKKLEKKYTEEDIQEIEDTKMLNLDTIEIDIREVTTEDELKRIRSVIMNNQGNSKIKIYYGSLDNTKLIERDIQINKEVIDSLRKYLVVTDSTLD
jgi:DNA-damage-inducible protein D